MSDNIETKYNNKLQIKEVYGTDANDVFKAALVENTASYSNIVMESILNYGYSRMAKEFNISANAVHKWFKNSSIPSSRLKLVMKKLDLTEKDFELVIDKDVWELIQK